MKYQTTNQMINSGLGGLVGLGLMMLMLLASSQDCKAQTFLPQSNLGRLVQSLAGSPLMLGLPAASATTLSQFDSDAPSSTHPGYSESLASHYAGTSGQQQPTLYESGPDTRPRYGGQQLQQAPSQQQRGIPQRYYPSGQQQHAHSNDNMNNNDDDDDQPQQQQVNHRQQTKGGLMSQGHQSINFEQGRAPSNARPSQEYEMGAYLGPTLDDKELNGVFNSNNDERDDADPSSSGPGYEEEPREITGSGSRKQAASSHAYNANQNNNNNNDDMSNNDNHDVQPSYPFTGASRDGASQAGPNGGGFNGYDEESADEDEGGPSMGTRNNVEGASYGRPNRGGVKGGRSMAAANQLNAIRNHHGERNYGLKQAAANQFNRHAHFTGAKLAARGLTTQNFNNPESNHQEGGPSSMRTGQSQLMAAANGYAPFGYTANGAPIDLSSLMAGMTGATEAYQGDGSTPPYPGQAYYQQQGNQGQAGRQQAASRQQLLNNNRGYGYPGHQGYGPSSSASGSDGTAGPNNQGQSSRGDPDENDNDNDED